MVKRTWGPGTRTFLSLFLALISASLVGCGGGTSSGSSPSSSASQVTVSINPSAATIDTGISQQFSSVVSGTSYTAVRWLVNGVEGGDQTNGTINGSGLYTAPSEPPASGTVDVGAQSLADSSKIAVATLSVKKRNATISVAVSPASATLQTNAAQQFSASVSGTTNTSVNWLVNGVKGGDSTNGTIDSTGRYIAPATAPGAAVSVSAQSAADSTKSGKATVTVTAPAPVAVSITPTTATLQTGLTQQFTASVSGTTNTAVTWLVNGVQGGNSTTGTVSSTGLYTAPATAPSSAVTVAAQSVADTTKSASASVTVTAAPKPISVSISPTSASMNGGATQQFTATVTNATNTSVNWFVNGVQGGATTTGTISTSGLYTAPASSANVTVTARSVYDATASASAGVTVTAVPGNNPPSPPSGPQYYVSTSGSDSNSGSQSSPWKTLTYAASKAGAGTTVHVAPGTYNSSSEMKLASSGTSSARVVFISDQQWGAKIVSSVSGNSTAVWITGDYVDFVGFDITGSGAAMGIYITGSNDRIIGNHVHNMATSGACPAGGGILNGNYSGASNVDIIGNVVHDIGVYNSPCSELHGIYTANPGGHIWNNIVFRNQGWGIHLWHAASQNNVSNNTVVNNGYGGILVGAGDGSWVNTGTVVTNNVVYQNGLFSGSGGFGIEEYGNTGTNTFKNNLVYGNGPSDWNLKNGDTASGSVSGNPLFATYTQYSTTNDYHLQSTSPALGKGITTYAPTYDLNGATRSTSTPTLGVYEYGGSSTWPYMY